MRKIAPIKAKPASPLAPSPAPKDEIAALKARLAALEAETARLRAAATPTDPQTERIRAMADEIRAAHKTVQDHVEKKPDRP